MAAIRIVDDWVRSPASAPSHYRSIMVIAEKWAEQRVLMRAYADSRDQLRPTIVLHGVELAIGPAGIDPNGSWGVHVDEATEGRAQHVKDQLEGAARRVAGSKGNPPRLVDEESTFEREPTANWGPGAPRVLPRRPDARTQAPAIDHYAPAGAARVPQQQQAQQVPQVPAASQSGTDLRKTAVPRPRARSKTQQHAPVTGGASLSSAGAQSPARTALGYSSGSGAQSAVVRLGLTPQVSARLGYLVDRIVPPDFQITGSERRVLNSLGEGDKTARAIGQMLDLADAVAFMEELVKKLEAFNLDLVEPGEADGGEPAYRLRR